MKGPFTIITIEVIERLQKIFSWGSDTDCDNNIKEFRGLLPALELYHNTYKLFNTLKERKFVEELIGVIEYYLEIAEKTGASTATISRVNRSLNYGNDGYDLAIQRIQDKQE